MVDVGTPPEELQEPDGPRVRWWFPAIFAVTFVAAAVAITLWLRDDAAEPPPAVPDLSSLGNNAPPIDDPAPEFTVQGFDGGTFTLSEHFESDGRPVMLNLWASWCAPCRKEMPTIDAAAARHPDVLFLGVAVKDAFSDAAEFAAEIGVAYPLAFDEGNVVDDGYQPLGLPATFFIDTDGAIVGRYFGELFDDTIDEELEAAFGVQ